MRIDAPIFTGSFSLNGNTLQDLGSVSTTGSNAFVGNQTIQGFVSASAFTGSINYTNLTSVPTLVSGGAQVIDILSSLNTTTASFSPRISNLESKSASVDISVSNINSITASNIARLTNLESKSASVDISITNINSFTSSNANTSLNTFSASNGNTSLNSLTGSYATTGSNTFFGTQTFSGSVYIANNLIVQGSSSIQYISASSVSIGTNIVQLNTANPSVRFAGLTMIDSGSVGGSGSFLYDSLQDEFIFVHRGNGTNITSSHFVLGPETYDNLGNETYLTCNILTKGTGKEHLVDSCIFDNGTTICLNGNTISTGTLSGTTIYGSTAVCSAFGYFSGCVGIGINNPGAKLQVKTSTSAGATDAFYIENTSLALFEVRDDGLIYMKGNVGIGTCSPTRLLDVSALGTAYIRASDRTNSVNVDMLAASSGGWVGTQSNHSFMIQTCNTEKMRITSAGNIGIGATPCAWASPSAGKVIQLGNRAAIFSYNNQTLDLSTNLYFDGGDYRYIESAYSTMLRQNTADGTYSFYNASSGTAGGVVSLNERMRITNVGMVCFACQICAPQFTSGAGTVDNPYGSWTTLFTIPSGLITTYIVHAVLYNQGGYYTNTIMLGVNASTISINHINNPGGACLRVNGYDVQVTNGSGGTQSINYRYTRLG